MRITGSEPTARILRAGTATVLAALCGPALAVLAVVGPARAATHPVTTTLDVDDLGACADGAVTTGVGPDTLLSLREAVCLARNAGTGTVALPAGTYTLTQGALAVKGGDGTVDVTITGAGATSTIIDGNAADRVVNVDPTEAGDVHLTMSGLAVRNGRPTDGYGGGGILAGAPTAPTGNSLTLSNCRITGNVNDATASRTNAPGGGVAVAGGDLTVTNCVISGNASNSSAGGGIYFSAQRAADDLRVDSVTFSANTMANTGGPGTTFNGGAALALRADVGGGDMDVTDSRFTGNTATGSGAGADARGGAVLVRSGSPTITRSVFTGNTATGTDGAEGRGGAVHTMTADTTTVTLSRIVGNTASHTGAVSQAAGTLDAARNWWGCNDGPNATGCDVITRTAGTLTQAPTLALGVTVAPPSIPDGTAATATAGFRTDSAGGDVAANQLGAFAGVPVTWTATGGTLSDRQDEIGAGTATATYTATAAGTGQVRAVVDGQQVDAPVTVTVPPVAPPAPTIGTATVGGSGELRVTWAPPGGADVDTYTVRMATGGPYAPVPSGSCAGAPAASPCTVTGLTPGTQYTFTVSGTSGGLEGPQSAPTAAVTAITTPGTPGRPTVEVAGNRALAVTWTPPPTPADRPVTGYRVEVSTDDGPFTAVQTGTCVDPTGTECTLTDLTPGSTYTVTVTAVNAAGTGDPGTASEAVTAVAAPDAPTIGTVAVSGPGTLTVPWTAPPGTVDSYRVYVSDGGPYVPVPAGTCAGAPSASPCRVTGLTPGVTYTFQVSGMRSGIEGTRSDASTGVTALAAATAPTGPTATPTDGGAVVTWTPPQPDTGVTGYTATLQPGGEQCQAPGAAATTCAVDGLANGTPYTVTVVAHSPAGDSPASGPATVTPGVAPGTPTGVQAVAGVASITVSWTAPASAGTGIAGYLVTASPGPATCDTTGATTCVLGAEGGTDYTVTVVARGLHGGDSAPSQASAVARPTVPQPPAAPPATTLTLTTDQGDTTQVRPGQKLVVSGTGFAPYSTVTVTVYSEPLVLATVTADANGAFSVPVDVPAGLEPGPHSFVALGVDPDGQTHSLRLDLTVPSPSSAVPPSTGDSLPVTGAGLVLMVVTGLSLLIGGAALRRLKA